MKNSDLKFRPIDKLEKKIFSDKEFLTAIKIGKPRKSHDEGTIKMHIIQILGYIDKNYYKTAQYEDLRIIALLHDIGKFAFLEESPDLFIPNLSENKCKKIIEECRKFRKKYYTQKDVPKNMRKYSLTEKHANVSYQFAKKFLKDKKLLELIRYHDLATDIRWEYEDTKKYDAKIFKKIFTHIDLRLYLAFLKCDNCNRVDGTSQWLKTQLDFNKIYIMAR